MTGKILSIVGVGCGGRTLTYCGLAAPEPHRYKIVGGADPNRLRVEELRKLSRNPGFRAFSSDKELFAAGKIADICIIGTQDSYHVEPALAAMKAGYDIVLEKPIARNPSEILLLLDRAEKLGRKVLVCHVLRYSPFYEKVKEIVASGVLGEIVTLDAREGVGAWHQAHSYVRGHWAVKSKATPMIVAKSCHDMDIISWMMGHPCRQISSYGYLSHFKSENAPQGAPFRCTDGCPFAPSCRYNALLYLDLHRAWLSYVMDGTGTVSNDEIRDWLSVSPWGRCVYHCDNDVVDHQVVMMDFDGGATATFTMTAFDEGREIAICGTKARLKGGESVRNMGGHDIVVEEHSGGKTCHDILIRSGGYGGHGGADSGLVQHLDLEFSKPAQEMRSGLHASVESHMMGFAAEESRISGRPVNLEEYRKMLSGKKCE